MKKNKNILIVGAEWAGQEIAETMILYKKYKILGFVDDRKVTASWITVQTKKGPLEIRVLGHSNDLCEIAESQKSSHIVIAVTHRSKDHLLSEIVKCHEKGIQVHQMPDLYSEITKKIPIKFIDHEWIIPRLSTPVHDLHSLTLSAIDYFVSTILLLCVYIPLFPLIALVIKATSPGPIFFRQKRTGFKGKSFAILKFRTMVNNARSEGAAWTTKTDSRITSVGKVLRKFRIDELPQLINIFKGEMALIGPRPEAVELVAEFKKEIPFYEYRYLVKPGITGWAQVNLSNTCSVNGALEKLQYDLFWIKKNSFRLDLKIILKSFRVIATGFGSV